jgi:hypothetical protein
MEFFLPSILVLIIAGIIVFAVLPRFAPLILITLSIAIMGAAMYHHYTFFIDEYRNITWTESLKMYAPGIVYGVMGIFVIGFILSFFNGGQVPVPSVPELQTPNIVNSIKNASNNSISMINNSIRNVSNNIGSLFKNVINTKNINGSKPRSSFFEEI